MDPARGRLWLICTSCGAWSLVPIDARWETLEELEKVATDRGRVMVKTDNVSLVESGDIAIVRIGQTLRKEEAWWRYLQETHRRSAAARKIVYRGKWKDVVWNTLLFGIPLPGTTPAENWIERARRKHFGDQVWTGTASCSTCGELHHELSFSDPVTVTGSHRGVEVRAGCWKCAEHGQIGYFYIAGLLGTRVAQRVLAYGNYSGAGEPDLDAAVSRLDEAESARDYVKRVTARPVELVHLGKPELLALEMAISEEKERELLSLEAHELEVRWKAEERLARIVDRELSPP